MRKMMDFHTHILPKMDDGSKDLEESVSLLRMLAEQGVKCVVATPHFHPNDYTIEVFLKRRQESYEQLLGVLGEDFPQVILGAEVCYYEGISRMPDLLSLCIGDTKVLLLEMPHCRWTESVLRELVHLANSGKITVLLAHVERYLEFQEIETWQRLHKNGIFMQVNAGYFVKLRTRGKARRLLKEGFIDVLGSDCHGMDFRPPNIGKATEWIKKKMGSEYIDKINIRSERLLKKNKKLFN